MTIVDRKTRCLLGWAVVWERTQEAIQQMVDEAPKAKWYYSDGFEAYARLCYHLGRYEVSPGTSDTFSVEADNAELRHYLARLARKSRCFSGCPYALQSALRLFAFCYNSRQLYKQRILILLLISWTLLAHEISHSLKSKRIQWTQNASECLEQTLCVLWLWERMKRSNFHLLHINGFTLNVRILEMSAVPVLHMHISKRC